MNVGWIFSRYRRHFKHISKKTVSLQGFEPSATTSIRRELRLISRWSRWATRAQCMSRDFTQATLAGNKTSQVQITAVKWLNLSFQTAGDTRYVTFVLADFLDPGQRVDLHEGVGNTDDVHHIHHTLTDTHRDTVTEVKMCRVKEVKQTESWLFSFSAQIYSRTVREYKFDVPDLSIFFSETRYTPPQLGKKCCFLYCTESLLNWANWGQKSARSGLFCLWDPDGFRFVFIFNLAKTSMCTLKPDCVENWYL